MRFPIGGRLWLSERRGARKSSVHMSQYSRRVGSRVCVHCTRTIEQCSGAARNTHASLDQSAARVACEARFTCRWYVVASRASTMIFVECTSTLPQNRGSRVAWIKQITIYMYMYRIYSYIDYLDIVMIQRSVTNISFLRACTTPFSLLYDLVSTIRFLRFSQNSLRCAEKSLR